MSATCHRVARLRHLVRAVGLALAAATALSAPAAAQPMPAPAPSPAPPALLRPVDGEVHRPFDGPAQRWSAGHRGVDLRSPVGSPVLAAADGRVAFVGHVVDVDVVSVEHADGYRTTYQPVRATVRTGQLVRAGDRLGWLEAGDECRDGCLHWGLRRGRDYLDPMLLLAADGVRLLPDGARPAPPPASAPAAMLPLLQAAPPASSGLARPVPGPVTSPFGMRLHPVLHVWKLHDGVDLGAGCGTPVHSAAAGRVVLVERNLAYGNRVVVEHGTIGGHAVRTSYNHLASFAVRPGQAVRQAQVVGAVGSTGYSTGCHLHFMVWRDGVVVDPQGALA